MKRKTLHLSSTLFLLVASKSLHCASARICPVLVLPPEAARRPRRPSPTGCSFPLAGSLSWVFFLFLSLSLSLSTLLSPVAHNIACAEQVPHTPSAADRKPLSDLLASRLSVLCCCFVVIRPTSSSPALCAALCRSTAHALRSHHSALWTASLFAPLSSSPFFVSPFLSSLSPRPLVRLLFYSGFF